MEDLTKKQKLVYKFNIFEGLNIVCGVSVRQLGSMAGSEKVNKKNVEKFCEILNIDPARTVFPRQTHSANIRFVDNINVCKLDNADGLITDKRNIFLGIVTADCLPICFFDRKLGLVGIAHAGYKGILKGIVLKMIDRFKKFGSNLSDIKIAIGPSIGRGCYDVLPDRIKQFKKHIRKIQFMRK